MRNLIIAFCVVLFAGLARADGTFAGTYLAKGTTGDITLTLREGPGNTLTGSISSGDTRLAITARVSDGKAVGSAGAADLLGKSYFLARREGNGLTIILADMDKAQQPSMQTARNFSFIAVNSTRSAGAAAPATPPVDSPDKWIASARGKTYKHPTGGMLRYPDDWELKETPDALQFIPPNMSANADAIFMVTAENVGDITRPDDPRLIQMIDGLVAQQLPLLKRVGGVEQLKSGSQPGAALVWEVVGQNGITFRANLYVTIIKGQAISLLGLGAKTRVMAHDKTLRQIFSTLAWGDAQMDRTLVGTWNYWSYTSTGLGTSNLSSSETRRTCVLKSDGTFLWQGSSEGYLSAKNTSSLGEVTSSGSVVGNSGDSSSGTWASGDGKLFLNHANGTYVAVKYEIKTNGGHRFLYIDAGGKKPQEWSEGK